MGIRKYNPVTPSLRWKTGSTFEEITKKEPEKSLTVPLKRTGGRNNLGRVTSRYIGGGHKKKLRIVDFKRDKKDVEAKVIAIEYDPNRNARLALLEYSDKDRRYIVAADQLKVGDMVLASEKAEIRVGNALPIRNIPLGTFVYNVEMNPGKGGQIARSAGNFAQIMAKEGTMAHLRLPSGEMRLLAMGCWATVGQVGNIEYETMSIGKAGRNRWLGIKPRVRGVAMNPIDHPLGGGEGKSSGGRHPCTPWGQPTRGYKTRNRKKLSGKYIVKRRK